MGKRVHSVTKAIEIMRFLASRDEGAGVSEISRILKINLSTCYNILRTLSKLDMINFDHVSKTYSVGAGVLDLARGFVATRKNVVDLVKPELEALAREYAVTITLWRRIAGERMMLFASFESSAMMSIHMNIGQRLPLYLGAMGRLLAANSGLDREALRKEFESLRWGAPYDFYAYLADVERSKVEGWAMDDGIFVKGTTTVSCPVFDKQGAVMLTVSATMFQSQHPQPVIHEMVQTLKSIADKMTTHIVAS